MNYYDELLKNLSDLLKKERYEEAYYTVAKELEAPYIPKDIEKRLNDLFNELKPMIIKEKNMSDEKIAEYLFKSSEEQLLAVSALINKNLRDYLNLVDSYLTSDGFVNAKVVLIDALIHQEISDEIHYCNNGMNYSFIPKFILPQEQSDGYLKAIKLLNEFYMKEPSKLIIAKDLLFKEAMLALPVNLESEEADELVEKIINYIETAFNS